MKEGIDKRISLGGIVRNTAGSISPDGQMDEMINLRLKDGSFRPMSPNVPLDGIKDVNIDYTNIFIHTCDYRHWIDTNPYSCLHQSFYHGTVYGFKEIIPGRIYPF